MKIAMVGDADKGGGAAIAAARLCAQLLKNGHHVNRFVVRKSGSETTTHACGEHSWLRKKLLGGLWRAGFRESHDRLSRRFFSERMVEMVRAFDPELVNVHNIHAAGLSVDLLPWLSPGGRAPFVWTLHDMWAMTGHCAYAYDCGRFTGECDETCPYPGEYPALKTSRIRGSFDLRRQVYGRMPNLVFVTPSRWLAGEAARGILSGHPVFVIPNGIDMTVFFPEDKGKAREILGLPQGRRILLTGAAHLKDKRKGMNFLVDSLRSLPSRGDYLLVTFGRTVGDSSVQRAAVEVREMGSVSEEGRQRLMYSAADAFVLPTLADNLPNVLVESIACGTPCIAFDVGGVSEVVRPGETGFLARAKDPDDLAAAILAQFSLSPERRTGLAASCRTVAEREYSRALQGGRYEKLFADLLASAGRSG
ncbi:MAG: glycosyltransferase [Deltaproteobacteria bacterium]|nr:glycosyltransferase [Deltaproteobacteria bacterium]MDH3382793.1 glycosyltransferase [Deltaproteobacteria bacterium]